MELGRYRLTTPLGVGGMGVVYGAQRVDDNTEVAIKLLSGVRAQEAAARDDFAHEIWSLARLDHPGVVAVLDYGVVEDSVDPRILPGTPFLVMERADGQLDHERFPLHWDAFVTIVEQILDGLAHAHARSVVHRDLKPSNVLWSARDNRWKLADFGIAHALDSHAVDGAWGKSVGTPTYMAPEQVMGLWRDFGPWTDLFAVGVLVYQLVSGLPPFPELTGKPLMRAVVERKITVPKARFPVPAGFDQWLARLLERNFLDRAQRAADVLLWLEQLGRPRSGVSAVPLAQLVDAGTTRTMPIQPEPTEPERTLSSDGRRRPPRRAVPPSWLALESPRARPTWTGALPQPIAFTGRERERDALWHALTRVDAGGGAEAVVIRGPIGSGRTALATWLLERAHELGVAWTLVCNHSDPPDPLDGVGAMFDTFLRCVGLPRAELVKRMHVLLQLHEGNGGLSHVIAELVRPAGDGEEVPLRFTSAEERVAAALASLQVLTGVLDTEEGNAPQRAAVVLIDECQRGSEALALVEMALANRSGLPTPVLFLLTAPAAGPEALDAIESLDGVSTLPLQPLPTPLLHALQAASWPGVNELRTGVGPPVKASPEALAAAIRMTITGTRTTSDDP